MATANRNESTEYYNGQEGEQKLLLKGSRLKTAYAEIWWKQNALTPSLVKNVWDNLKDSLGNDCWYFTFYIIDWF